MKYDLISYLNAERNDFLAFDVTVGFLGDYSLCRYFQNNDVSIEKELQNQLRQNNHNIINFESPFTLADPVKTNGLGQHGEHCFDLLRECNVDICNLANNHLGDCGIQGIQDTIDAMQVRGFSYLGAGMTHREACKPIVLKAGRVEIGIISFCHNDGIVSSPLNDSPGILSDTGEENALEQIRSLKERVTWCIVLYHGGVEFLHEPSPQIRKKYLEFLNAGADIVLAHHPHVVQGYEFVGEKCIFYSLGNFYFDTPYQRTAEGTDHGLIIRLAFSTEKWTFYPIFTKINRDKKVISAIEKCEYFNLLCPEENELRYYQAEYDRNCQVVRRELNSQFGLLKCIDKTIFSADARKRYLLFLGKRPK